MSKESSQITSMFKLISSCRGSTGNRLFGAAELQHVLQHELLKDSDWKSDCSTTFLSVDLRESGYKDRAAFMDLHAWVTDSVTASKSISSGEELSQQVSSDLTDSKS